MNELRPSRFNSLIGQKRLLESLMISVQSANNRNTALNHTLFSGPPGLGKTTLANALANELGVDIQTANGANLRSIKSIVPYIMRVKERSVLFIDEIHRMTKLAEEFLYPIMEDFKLDMAVEGETPDGGSVISIPIPKFTIVGATTEPGALSAPFRDRFKLKFTLELYDVPTLTELVGNNCNKLRVPLTDPAKTMLAKASRGTPRIANGLLEWIRDYRIAKSLSIVSEDDLEASLSMRGIGLDGSTENDRRYLDFLKKQKGPVGVSTISSSLNIDRETIEEVVEPFLLQQGKISKTTKGRIAL